MPATRSRRARQDAPEPGRGQGGPSLLHWVLLLIELKGKREGLQRAIDKSTHGFHIYDCLTCLCFTSASLVGPGEARGRPTLESLTAVSGRINATRHFPVNLSGTYR